MTQQEQVQAIIEKAVKNGFKHPNLVPAILNEDKMTIEPVTGMKMSTIIDWLGGVESLIFDKQFLQAFFPSPGREDKNYMDNIWPQELWEYHAQKLVLSDNRIDYLYQFIEQAK